MSDSGINVEIISNGGGGAYDNAIRRQQSRYIVKAIKEGKEIEYYHNFVVIDGKTFNGYNEDVIAKLMKDLG